MFQYKPYIKVSLQHNLYNCAIGNLGFKLRGLRVEKFFSFYNLGCNANSSFNDRDGVEKWAQR